MGDDSIDGDGDDNGKCFDLCGGLYEAGTCGGVFYKAAIVAVLKEHIEKIKQLDAEVQIMFDEGHFKVPDEYAMCEEVSVQANKVLQAVTELNRAVEEAKRVFEMNEKGRAGGRKNQQL